MRTEKIQINEANIKNNHFYLSSIMTFFPSDSVGGSNKENKAESEIRITLPFGEDICTDIAGDKNIFRQRAWVGELYKYRNISPGDYITLTWLAPYHLKIDTERKVVMDETKRGQTIQVLIDNESWLARYKYEIPSGYKDFFPADALGARGKADADTYPLRGSAVGFDYGFGKSFCDVATRKSGAMRPRDNSGMRQFLEGSKAAMGDVVCITRTDERRYKVSLVKLK